MKFNKQYKKEKGQISVFLALVFFVMFSIFGMTISMGMFIHDKINLQNATDLASYYVAAKQAEMLGAIAHSNYQIRQSWKLLAFRYRVLGNASRTDGGMMSPGIMSNPDAFLNNHSPYQPASHSGGVPPRICMGSAHVFKEITNDSICKIINFSVNYIPNVPQIIGIGIVGATNTTIDSTNNIIANRCSAVAYLNWWFANTIIGAHKLEQRDRRAVIEELAKNLAKPIAPGGMKDLDGADVFEGARKTFVYNLTEANKDSTRDIRFKNSIEGKNPEEWLSPIYVNAIVPWSFYDILGSDCSEQVFNHPNDTALQSMLSDGTSETAAARLFRNTLDPNGVTKGAGALDAAGDPLMGFSVGVEKNPWVMIYNKAESVAVSQPLFLSSVFGEGIRMMAVAYSKPFGGRIGPWYFKNWPSGADKSSGGGRTDPLLPTRVDLSGLGAVSNVTSDPTYFPNYSRHPGDQDGLTTRASQVFAGRLVGWTTNNPTAGVVKSSMRDYVQTTYSYFNGLSNDPLAQDFAGSAPWESFNRNLEIAAIRPDAFDVTYYSISPTFYNYYVKGKLDQWLPPQLPAGVELRGDAGFHKDGPPGINDFDVLNQIELDTYGGVDRRPKAAWVNNGNKSGFLSSWLPGVEVMDFGSPDTNRFAACADKIQAGREMIPSECVSGGRVGYSVKLISRKYLEASHPIGGGGNSGTITNPPDSL